MSSVDLAVLVVDDDYHVAHAHALSVTRIPGFQVVGEAHTAREAVSMAAETVPDLLLLDMYLPDGSGLEVMRRLADGDLEQPDVIAVTAARDIETVRMALQLSPYNRTYLRLLGPCAMSLVITAGLRLLVRSLDLHPEWLWIGIALVVSYASFCGLALLAGLDKDDKMIVAAIRSRVLGATGRAPSLSQ